MNKFDSKISTLLIFLLLFVLLALIAIKDTLIIGDADPLALIGAVIGGIITLVGVQYTIRSSFEALTLTLMKQEDAKLIETMGHKLQQLNKVKGIIYKTDRILSSRKYGRNEQNEEDIIENIDSSFYKFFFPNLNILIEHAASVDWFFYNDIRTFVDQTREYIFEMNDESISRLKFETSTLIEKIHTHENRLSEKYKETSITSNDNEASA